MEPLRSRQIHLDFHTAGQIPDVGADWDAQAFVETLQRAHVNSVTVFARCHHGYVYYMPTRFEPHPALKVNLLGEQVEALHRAGIRAPIYTTVGWDELAAARHPEWQETTPEGVRGINGPLVAGWKKLCLNTPYLDYVWEHTVEFMDLLAGEVDGIFFDIVRQVECVCPHCLEGMARQNLNPELRDDRLAYAQQVTEACRRRLGLGAMAKAPGLTVFHNAGHVDASQRATLEAFTHLELESLPSTGIWGYNHYPISVRYARTLGLPTLGMTGKFHTAWGDFSSLKNRAALEYECFQMLANGSACSIGDQLHPRGRLSEAAYDLIGQVYGSVAAKEPWCLGAEPVTELAVFNVEAAGVAEGRVDPSHAGALRMLLESHHQFDFVDDQADWSRYRVLVFPDKVPFSEALAAKVRAYLRAGGKVIATGRSGLRPDGQTFALDEFGLDCAGPAPYSPDYIRVGKELGVALGEGEQVMYDQAMATCPHEGTATLADVVAPYFNRAWNHFCSHRQTPPDPSKPAGYPAITINAAGDVVYMAHPVFAGYRRQAPLWYKRLFLAALRLLLPDPLVETDAPSTAQVTLMRQREQGRSIAHLLHYIPERRGTEFDTIEDVIPLFDVALAFAHEREPRRVYLAPSGSDVPFTYEGGKVRLRVPKVEGHQMVVAE